MSTAIWQPCPCELQSADCKVPDPEKQASEIHKVRKSRDKNSGRFVHAPSLKTVSLSISNHSINWRAGRDMTWKSRSCDVEVWSKKVKLIFRLGSIAGDHGVSLAYCTMKSKYTLTSTKHGIFSESPMFCSQVRSVN